MTYRVLPDARSSALVCVVVRYALVAVMAGGLLGGCSSVPEGDVPPPPDPETLLADAHLDKIPPRTETGLELSRMGWRYNCMECHRHLKPRWHHDRPLVEHRDLVLDHGGNRFCLNCHHPDNRNSFVDYDGSEIPQEDVTLLCAKCHGPIYRDWARGIHGRRNGHWLQSVGTHEPLRCIQCHDPHAPAFPPLRPMAAPIYPERAAGTASAHVEHAPRFAGEEHLDEH
jgi:hypothetical protein